MKAKVVLSLVAMTLCAPLPLSDGKRSMKDWGKMNLDDLNTQWEDGDDEEELKTEQQAQFERLERQRKQAQESAGAFDPSLLGKMDPSEINAMAAGQKDAAGPTMMFAEVFLEGGEAGAEFGGGTLSEEETERVGGRLQQLALLGGLELSVYPIDPGSVLVSTQKGWEGNEVLDFLLSRPEVSNVMWNSKKFSSPPQDTEL